ncbi:hypothetical protein A6R68_23437 [Neotoma lepida]|uniref:Myosin motor domain-containing protein n=1 Tax=Neotoma lepida TaxID=56216 RepID=A0A1A6HXX1_NEOLE|nr:hypothetical protein A6R68_23437 [Neotoma lepida]
MHRRTKILWQSKVHMCRGSALEKSQETGQFDELRFAAVVMYEIGGAVERNRDCLSQNLLFVMKMLADNWPSQDSPGITILIASVESAISSAEELAVRNAKARGWKSLADITGKLQRGSPHFIHCIKPNTSQLPGVFDHFYVSAQLQYLGVLGLVKLFRYGYPVRPSFEDFLSRSVWNRCSVLYRDATLMSFQQSPFRFFLEHNFQWFHCHVKTR